MNPEEYLETQMHEVTTFNQMIEVVKNAFNLASTPGTETRTHSAHKGKTDHDYFGRTD